MRRVLALLGLIALATLVGGCMPSASTSEGRAISGLYNDVFFLAAIVVFVIVAGLITWSIFRYRHRPDELPFDPARLPPQYHGNLVLEAIWTALPILTVLGLFGATMLTLGVVQAKAPEDALQVHVTAFQWSWRFDYTDYGITIVGQAGQSPVLTVPAGRTIAVTETSADVNHAFYVPAFLFKMDAIPGRVNQFRFTVDSPGTYRGQCAEFCGIYHDRMLFTVQALTASDFAAWLAQQPRSSPAAPSPTSIVSPSPSPLVSSPAPSASR